MPLSLCRLLAAYLCDQRQRQERRREEEHEHCDVPKRRRNDKGKRGDSRDQAAAGVSVHTMAVECAGLISALTAYGECPTNDDTDQAWAARVAEVAQQSFDAGKKGNPDEPSQHVIALACHRAAESVKHANERCHNGPKPPR